MAEFALPKHSKIVKGIDYPLNSEAENTEGENSDEDIQLSDETMSAANEVDDINKDAMQEDKDISKQHDDALQEDNILNSENETPNESQEY